jgi:hypothetical protein
MARKMLGVIVAIVIGIGYTAFDYFTGEELGGQCSYNNDCKGNLWGKMGSQCLDDGFGSYCTVTCSSPADCPAGWTCETVSMTENSVETGETNSVCARPAPGQAAPGEAPAATPAAAPAAPVAPAPAPAQ